MRVGKVTKILTPVNSIVICPGDCVNSVSCPFRVLNSKSTHVRTDQELLRSTVEPVKNLILEAGKEVRTNNKPVLMYTGAGSAPKSCYTCMFYQDISIPLRADIPEAVPEPGLYDSSEPKNKGGRKKKNE